VEQRNWLQRLFGRFFGRRTGLTQVKVMAGYTPIFTPWGERPYEADVVRAAVDAIARNAAKLKAKHIRRVNGEVIHVKNSDIERVLSLRPNPKMSAYDLLVQAGHDADAGQQCLGLPCLGGRAVGGRIPS